MRLGKRGFRLPVALALMVVVAGCMSVGNGRPPDWVMGQSREYPSNRYLIGVGAASSRARAEERAYAAIARIFSAEIEAQTSDWESYSVSGGKTAVTTTRRLTLDHVTQVTTRKVLENVHILDTWYHPTDRQHFVLAGMKRAQVERTLLDQISEHDITIEKEVAQGRTGTTKLTKIRGFKRAINHLLLREAVNVDLRVVRENGIGVDSNYKLSDLKKELEDYLAENVVIEVQIEGEQQAQIRRAVLEGLGREGLVPLIKESNSNSGSFTWRNQGTNGITTDLLISGTARLWEIDLPDPLFRYVRWCSDLQVVEQGSLRLIGIVSRSGREGHITPEEARVRASKAMQAAVSSEVAESLAAYIYGEGKEDSVTHAACPK